MNSFFVFLQTHRAAILLLLFCLASIVAFVQWIAWIFNKGRFGTNLTSGRALAFVFSEAAVKIINDFRHLLALIVVLIFAFALGYSLIKAASFPVSADTPTAIANMKEALQAVVATLGGLVGSIIGYYFGESSVVKSSEPRPPNAEPDTTPIKPVPPPPLPHDVDGRADG